MHEGTSDQLKMRGTLQSHWPVIFDSFNIIKIKEGLKNYSRLKETTQIGQLNTTCNSGVDPLVIKILLVQLEKFGVWELDGNSVSLVTLILMVATWLCGRIPRNRKCTLRNSGSWGIWLATLQWFRGKKSVLCTCTFAVSVRWFQNKNTDNA